MTAVALAGCAALDPPPAPVDAVISEAVAVARAPAAEQRAALEHAQKASAGGAPAERLRLAMLLATLPAPLRDDARALDLLQSVADSASPGIGRFAAVLAAQVAERQRLAHELDRLKSEHERSLKEHDKREEALKQQIEALRAIERGILEREEKMRRTPR
jgi:hypothetical protein